MPSLVRLLSIMGVLVPLAYAGMFALGNVRGTKCPSVENNAGPLGPACACLNKAADYAFAVSASQILISLVSGIKNSPSTKHTAGTAIG